MADETGLAGVPPFWAPLPPKLPRTVLTWIWPLVTMKGFTEADLIESVGLDAVMLIRHIRFGETGCTAITIWGGSLLGSLGFRGTTYKFEIVAMSQWAHIARTSQSRSATGVATLTAASVNSVSQ
jgi:hypothetical protein